MSLKSGQAIVRKFAVKDSSGEVVDADSLPTGTLTIDGVDDGATVTITNTGTGRYKAAVTLPAVTPGQSAEIDILAIIATINVPAVINLGIADTKRVSELNDLSAAALDSTLSAAHGSGSWTGQDTGGVSPTLVYEKPIGTPQDNVRIWLTSADGSGNDTGAVIHGSKHTNASGEVTFSGLDASTTYWAHASKSGCDFADLSFITDAS